jgi:polyisoprenoid-binding protein YceI
MSTTAQQVPTATYDVDLLHSSIGFGVKHLGLSTYTTGFAAFTAQLGGGILTGTAQTGSLQIADEAFKAHVLAEDFLDAEAAPTLSFRSTAIRVGEGGGVEVDGQLTIKGITKPITATGEFATGADSYGNERVAFDLEAVIDRRAHGLTWQAETPNGSDAVGWGVTLHAHLELVAAA